MKGLEAMTSEERQAWRDLVASLKEQHRESGRPGRACLSADCANYATVRILSWPLLKGETPPEYCAACAAIMRSVMDALGMGVIEQSIPLPPNLQATPRGVAIGKPIGG